jgi:D-methionine transport system ATP-binding protein
MIELANVSKIYSTASGGFTALKNVNLKVNAGEIFGIIGKSGAGKSTLIRCVNLIERPTEGQIIVDNRNLTTLSEAELRYARRHIGMIFQHFNLLATRTVYENVALPLELEGLTKEQIAQTVLPLLELTHLETKRDAYPADLSGGQKQRVAIARALACKPRVLLCDEATSALDLHTTKSILALLKDINKHLNLSILLITHEIEVVKEICDRVALIDHGEIIEENDIYSFFTEPKTALGYEFIKNSLKYELPFNLKDKLLAQPTANTHAVLRIVFHGHAAAEPFVAQLMQELGIKLNILQANIEFLKQNVLGIMIVEALNAGNQLEQGIAYLQNKNVKVEILGYVNSNAI